MSSSTQPAVKFSPPHLITPPSTSNQQIRSAFTKNVIGRIVAHETSLKDKEELHNKLIHYCRMLQTRHYDQRPFDETGCDAIIANDGVKNLSKKVQKVCDGGAIKHGSDFICMCHAGIRLIQQKIVCDEEEQQKRAAISMCVRYTSYSSLR